MSLRSERRDAAKKLREQAVDRGDHEGHSGNAGDIGDLDHWQKSLLAVTELVPAVAAHQLAAGELYYPYVAYPYFEWYSDNGRVVLELDPSNITVIRPGTPPTEKSPQELAQDWANRAKSFGNFMHGIVESFRKGEER